jgi:hypothetical protein
MRDFRSPADDHVFGVDEARPGEHRTAMRTTTITT